jgi:hypothetical protein
LSLNAKKCVALMGLTTFLTKGILIVFNTTFQKKMEPSQKRRWVLHNFSLTSQWLQRFMTFIISNPSCLRVFVHFHILVKLFGMILMHLRLDFRKNAIFSSQFKHQFRYYQHKPRNRNNKGSSEICMVLILWKVLLKLKFECDKQFLHYKDNYWH